MAPGPGITDAGFVHLQGIQELMLASYYLNITGAAFSHLGGIVSLDLQVHSGLVTDDSLACLSGIESLTLLEARFITGAGLHHLAGIMLLHISHCPQFTVVLGLHIMPAFNSSTSHGAHWSQGLASDICEAFAS